MKFVRFRCGILFLFSSAFLISTVLHAEPKGVKRSEDMEFDARTIQGQRAEGAVYLFQRAARPLPPLLKFERDYLGTIVYPHFGRKTALGRRLSVQDGFNTQSVTPVVAKPKVPSPQSAIQTSKSTKKTKRRKKRSTKKLSWRERQRLKKLRQKKGR